MKRLIYIISICIAVMACNNNNNGNNYRSTSDPREYILQHLIPADSNDIYYAEMRHRFTHKSEIEKTLTINETVEIGDLAAIFYSYSIGADVVRGSEWVEKIDNKFYSIYVSAYGAERTAVAYDVDVDDLKKIIRKCDSWEANNPMTKWNH